MYWTVTESRITQKKKKIFNPFFSTKIKVSSIFERDSVHQVVSHSLNNTHEKMTRLWLAENECIFHVTRLQIIKNAHAAKISSLYLQILTGWKGIAYEKFEKVLRGAAAWVSYSWKGFSPPALAGPQGLTEKVKNCIIPDILKNKKPNQVIDWNWHVQWTPRNVSCVDWLNN